MYPVSVVKLKTNTTRERGKKLNIYNKLVHSTHIPKPHTVHRCSMCLPMISIQIYLSIQGIICSFMYTKDLLMCLCMFRMIQYQNHLHTKNVKMPIFRQHYCITHMATSKNEQDRLIY